MVFYCAPKPALLQAPSHTFRHRPRSSQSRVIGRADIGSREVIDFSSQRALSILHEAFAKAITQWWEGFVLKRCDGQAGPGQISLGCPL
jgi:hypothetical protein